MEAYFHKSVLKVLIGILVAEFKVSSDVSEDSDFYVDTALSDYLELNNLALRIEEVFGVNVENKNFPEEGFFIDDIKTIGKLAQYVANKATDYDRSKDPTLLSRFNEEVFQYGSTKLNEWQRFLCEKFSSSLIEEPA